MSGIWGNLTSGVARMATSPSQSNSRPSASTSSHSLSSQSQAPGKLPEHLEPHKALQEMLTTLPEKAKMKFGPPAKVALLRYLYNTVFCKAEWIPYLLADNEPLPLPREAEYWVWHDEAGTEFMYSLREVQERVELRRRKAGKQPVKEYKEGRMCGKTLHRYDRTYTCKTCAIDPSCVICVDCFQASDHEGHEVLFSQSYSFAAACDCGDATAWRPGGNRGCAHHIPPSDPSASTPERGRDHLTDHDIPPALIQSLYQAIVTVLEFIITTQQFMPLPTELGQLPKDESELKEPEGVTALPRASRGQGPWSVVVWADDRHTIKEVTRQIRDACGITWEMAELWAREIDQVGRKTIITTPSPTLAFHTASMFQQIDMGVNLRPAYDVFRDEMAGLLTHWLADMMRCTVGSDGELISRLVWRALNEARQDAGMNEGTGLPRDLIEFGYTVNKHRRIDWVINLDPRLWKSAKWDWRSIYATLYAVDWEVRRELAVRFAINYVFLFEHFLFQDRDVDSALLFCVTYIVFGNGPACAWASEKAKLFILVLNVAQAWFTGQTLDNRLVMPPLDIDRADPSPDRRLSVDDMPAFRGKKGTTLFMHVRALFRHEEMQRLIATKPAWYERACQFLNLFVGLQTQKKENGNHVEFEVEWIKTFTYLGELAKTAQELGESLQYSPQTEVYLQNLSHTGCRVYNDIHLRSNILDPTRYRNVQYHTVSNVLVPGSSVRLIKCRITEIEAFSFHHYINLLLAEAFKQMPSLDWKRQGDRVVIEARDMYKRVRTFTPTEIVEDIILASVSTLNKDVDKLTLMEFPLQKLVIISQIRADLWRKNGSVMRGQSHHYRDINVRDVTLDQEFFALQAALCTMPPLTFFSALIDRFEIADFFSRDVNQSNIWDHEQIEPRQFVGILEDFLLLCIRLAKDVSSINQWSRDEITRTHIIQQLGLGPLMYSELHKKLPERTNEATLIPFLKELADFKPPTDTASGSYSLKEQYAESVDPYWHHYSRNDQRKALDQLLEHRKRTKNADLLIKPLPLQPPNSTGPWYNLFDWLGDRLAHEIIHYAIAHCGPIAAPHAFPGLEFVRSEETMPTFDLLLDLALQLAMIIISHDPSTFVMNAIQPAQISGALSTFQQLWLMQTTDAFKPWKPQVDYIISVIIANVPETYMRPYHEQQEKLRQAAEEPKPDARAAAAQRQKAIMANFAKKQANFAALLDEDDMDEDEEEETHEETFGPCIVCQEQVTRTNTGGMLALFQPSRIVRDCVADRDWFEETILAPSSMDQATRYHRFGQETTGEPINTDGYPSQSHKFGVHISACTHLMHESCMNNYFDATRYRHTQQVQRHHPENAVRFEYLCPLCKSLCNMLVPLDPTVAQLRPYFNSRGKLPSLSDKIREVSSEGLLKVRDSQKVWDHHNETGEMIPWFSDCFFHTVTLDPAFRRQVRTTARMIEKFRNLVRPLSEQSTRTRNRKSHMYIPDDVVAYTVASTEISLRGLAHTGETVADQVPETTTKLIKHLIGLLQLELDLYFGAKWDRTALRVGIFARLVPDWYRASSLPSPLLLRNPLVLVIETAAIAPDLLHSVIHLAYYAELTRTMVGISMWIKRCLGSRTPPSSRTSPPADRWLADALNVFRGFRPIMVAMLRNTSGPLTDLDTVLNLASDEVLSKLLYSHTLPFLRRCAIIFKAVSGTYPDASPVGITSSTCEYIRLLKFLSISNPVSTLSNQASTETPIVARWLNQWAMQGRIVPQLEYPGIYELARLPLRWEDVVLKYADRKCDQCGTKPTFPALCLFCGALVCLAGDCCSEGEQGECNIHMRDCGAVVGMFADIKRWLLVYLYAGSGSFGHMPYLDQHGELDINMRYFMHLGRMDELRRTTWLQHTIPHLTARKLELTSDGGGWASL